MQMTILFLTIVCRPHFLYGDPSLRQGVTGMHPDPEKHSFTFDVLPVRQKRKTCKWNLILISRATRVD